MRRFSSLCLATLETRTYPEVFAPPADEVGGAYLCLRAKSHRQSTIDLDYLAGDVACVIRQ